MVNLFQTNRSFETKSQDQSYIVFRLFEFLSVSCCGYLVLHCSGKFSVTNLKASFAPYYASILAIISQLQIASSSNNKCHRSIRILQFETKTRTHKLLISRNSCSAHTSVAIGEKNYL